MQRRNPFHACLKLLMEMCSRTSSTPSGDSQKHPSQDSGRVHFLQWKTRMGGCCWIEMSLGL